MTVQFTNCVTGEPTRSAFSALNSFFAEGNLIENGSGIGTALRSISHGTWQQIGKRTVIARSELQLFENNLYTGYQVIQRHYGALSHLRNQAFKIVGCDSKMSGNLRIRGRSAERYLKVTECLTKFTLLGPHRARHPVKPT